MDTFTHPAVEVAIDALGDADRDLSPVAVVDRGGLVAVAIESPQYRYMIFVQYRDGQWRAPDFITASPRRSHPLQPVTPPWRGLRNLSTKFFASSPADDEGWFAVTGVAAEDAVSISVHSALEKRMDPIGRTRLAFTAVRALRGESPQVSVYTQDGRRIPATI